MRISGITYIPRKTHVVRNFIIGIIILAFLSALIIVVISAISGWRLIHPSKEPLAAFSSSTAPAFKEVSFHDIDKEVLLKGWMFNSKGSTKTVILAHGYARNRLQFGEKTLDMVKGFLDKGYNVLLFDFRNSGLSEGSTSTIGILEKKDVLGAVKFAKSQGSSKVALLGFSMGAASSILAASESTSVDAVIADSSFSDLNEYINAYMPLWSKLPAIPFNKTIQLSVKLMSGLDPADASPREAVSKIAPRPVFFIHSSDDKKVPVENSKELFDAYFRAAGSKAEFWESSGAGHTGTYDKNPTVFMDRVLSFLDRSL